jgi:hypothetical protein
MHMPNALLGTFHDSSGKVTVSVFERTAGSPQQHFYDYAASVSDDMVAIGGGAEATNVPWGALLTASYPNQEFSEWRASSKDHVHPNPHKLKVYAIGLKIQGMNRQQLLEHVRVFRADSDVAHHPECYATLNPEYALIGGGFNVNWRDFNINGGNLATASFPQNSFSWKSRSKDHGVSSVAIVTSYAIGIKRSLPVGNVEVAINQVTSGNANHPTATVGLPEGFALTGVGAEAHWLTQGSLLWRLRPTTEQAYQDAHAASKDHDFAEPCTITTYALGIRIL